MSRFTLMFVVIAVQIFLVRTNLNRADELLSMDRGIRYRTVTRGPKRCSTAMVLTRNVDLLRGLVVLL